MADLYRDLFNSIYRFIITPDKHRGDGIKWNMFQVYLYRTSAMAINAVGWTILGTILIGWPIGHDIFNLPELSTSVHYWRFSVAMITGAIMLTALHKRLRYRYLNPMFFLASTIIYYQGGYWLVDVEIGRMSMMYLVYLTPLLTTIAPATLRSRTMLTLPPTLAWGVGIYMQIGLDPTLLYYGGFILFEIALASLFIGHMCYYEILRDNFFTKRKLKIQQQTNESILSHTLPTPIIKRLKDEGRISDKFDNVTVVFADIVSFTPLANELPPEEIVSLLDNLFTTFDHYSKKHGVEKIKTIGDEYFAAGGVPEADPKHAVRCARLAQSIHKIASTYSRPGGSPIKMRIGLHTGSLVAGIIGSDKFAYDVWGDIVNVGSRVESASSPGQTLVTQKTKQDIASQMDKDEFHFGSRQTVTISGREAIDVYPLRGSSFEPTVSEKTIVRNPSIKQAMRNTGDTG